MGIKYLLAAIMGIVFIAGLYLLFVDNDVGNAKFSAADIEILHKNPKISLGVSEASFLSPRSETVSVDGVQFDFVVWEYDLPYMAKIIPKDAARYDTIENLYDSLFSAAKKNDNEWYADCFIDEKNPLNESKIKQILNLELLRKVEYLDFYIVITGIHLSFDSIGLEPDVLPLPLFVRKTDQGYKFEQTTLSGTAAEGNFMMKPFWHVFYPDDLEEDEDEVDE